tara:strand:- start:1849 stop:2379 length:531 start_codon:yes stop_codon:yes gene_type:complete
MQTILSISEVQATLNNIGLNAVDVDTNSECPILIVEDIFSLSLPDFAHPNSEFHGFALKEDPNEGSGNVIKGDMYFLLSQVYNHLFTQVGWDVQDLTSGNATCPILNIEKLYPFEEDVRYVVACPNSDNDNVENEEFNAFEVAVLLKGDEGDDLDWSKSKQFKTITDVIEFIYGEE